ncbi:MAG: hypothetical protein AAFP04_12965 [Myxococcota bacterium]
MTVWSRWKQSFDYWENATAGILERAFRNPYVLTPAGHMLTTSLRLKAMSDALAARWWGSLGLPTRRDQERTLHALNKLQSRVFDLEDRLRDLEAETVRRSPRD